MALVNGIFEIDGEGTFWYQDGQLHREDGPAVIRWDLSSEYWIHGDQVKKEYTA